MRAIFRKYGIFLALIAVAALSVLLFVKCNEPELKIVIGRPVEGSETAADFTNSPKFSKKATNGILFALLSSKALPEQASPGTPPDRIMMIQNGGISYVFSVWLDESDLIYAKQIDGEAIDDYRVASLSDDELGYFENISSMHKGR